MWLFTSIGFFTAVEHPDDPGTILVRAREREDLENLRRAHLPDLEIVAAEDGFTVLVSRDEWEHAAQGLVAGIDYSSFAPPRDVMRSLQSS